MEYCPDCVVQSGRNGFQPQLPALITPYFLCSLRRVTSQLQLRFMVGKVGTMTAALGGGSEDKLKALVQ